MSSSITSGDQTEPTSKRARASAGSLLHNVATFTLLAALGLVVLIGIAYQALAVTHIYPLDYGEAPLIDQAVHLARGENIYRPDLSTPPYLISNYPPLYVISLVPFVALFGPSFFFGRLISIVCAWVSAACIGLIVYRVTRDRLAALVSGSIFLAFPFVVSWSSLARIDLLALALSLAGLCVLVRPSTSLRILDNRRLLIGSLLLVGAIFTRQSYALAAPLAAFVWLLLHEDFKRAFGLALLVGGMSGALFLALNVVTQGGFYFHIVTANVNEWSADRLSWNLNRFRDAAPILLALSVFAVALGAERNSLWSLVAPYLFGAVVSALTVGKIGSNVNYFLELCAALSLTAGAVFAWVRQRGNSPASRLDPIAALSRRRRMLPAYVWDIAIVALAALVVVQAAVMIRITLLDDLPQLQARRAAFDDLQKLERVVAAAEGPVLADEYMGLLTLQRRPLVIQPFEITQLANAGLWDQSPVLEGIDAKAYPLILVHYFPEFPVYKERWTPHMLDALNRSYRLTTMLANTGVYLPVGVSEAPSAMKTPERCSNAPWRLPGEATLGVRWDAADSFRNLQQLKFLGRGKEGKTPVVAVADGVLKRLPGRPDALVIQHDDPLRPGEKVWTFYGGMADASGESSFVSSDLAAAENGAPVKAGQLLGYQGTWSGRPLWRDWLHVDFAVVRPDAQGNFPASLTPENMLDPAPYLGLAIKPRAEEPDTQPLACAK
jgi:hypothetical protein